MIESIRICNFKSLRDVTVELSPVTVLIGRSGTGKTNFVHAIRFLRDYLQKHDGAVNEMGGWERMLCATRAPGAPLLFDVAFKVPGIDRDFRYTLSLAIPEKHDTARFACESLTVDGQAIFAQGNGQWSRPPDLVDAPRPDRPVLGLLYGIPDARLAHVILTKGVGCYDFPGNVLCGERQRDDTGLLDNGSNYLAALDAINTNLAELGRELEMRAALQKLNRSITSVDLSADRNRVHVGHKVADAKVLSFAICQESEGFRRFLAHLIALYQQPPKQVLVFEEPEKGIYPGALAVLAEYFQAIAASGRSQVILTTHSPQLLKHFAADQIRVVTMDGYDTAIGPVAPEQRESLEQHLMTADELLTVDEARSASATPNA
jgi:ABC-type branched-subunit amino acid transport system ATPase component